jgi:transglycosylase-like protein with SLT domain
VTGRLILRLLPAAGIAGLLAFASVVAALPGSQDATAATQAAARDIPPDMLALYREAATTCPGLSWSVLAGIGSVESAHGRNAGESSAGALGPMQFLPETWQRYGLDADGDGLADVHSARDAVFGAVMLLCANGGANPATLDGALFAYNHAQWYVDEVRLASAQYAAADEAGALLLANPRIVLSDWARGDIAAGRVHPRLLELLAAIAERHTITVSVIETGHTFYVEGTTRMSLHAVGQAADISVIDGEPVGSSSAGTRDLVQWLAGSLDQLGVAEVGSPFVDLLGAGLFSDESHMDHVHLAARDKS